jgi:predicted transcriptional regulator of viral defense system
VLDDLREWPVFTMRDVEKRAKSRAYAKLLVHNKLAKGEIARMGKGVYSFHADPALAVFAFKPAYLGLEYALSLHEAWEQEAIPVIITSRKVRCGVRQAAGENVLVRRASPHLMFGFELHEYYGFHLPVSGAEKTIVDFAYFNEPLPAEALEALLRESDVRKLTAYFKRAGLPGLAEKAGKGKLAESMRLTSGQ